MSDSSEYRSSSYTRVKQAHFSAFLDMQMDLVEATIARNHWASDTFLYIDLHSGYGRDLETGEDGSPLIFLKKAAARSLKYEAIFYERDKAACDALKEAITPYPNCAAYNIDHNELINKMKPFPKQYGLIYADPSDADIPADLLRVFNNKCPYVDILINVACTSIKRMIKSSSTQKRVERLNESLDRIGKKAWLVRNSYYAHQWTMLVGSNWGGYPDYKRYGFYQTTSAKGGNILVKLIYTQEEIDEYNRKDQPRLL